jgi:hypothetical protein
MLVIALDDFYAGADFGKILDFCHMFFHSFSRPEMAKSGDRNTNK